MNLSVIIPVYNEEKTVKTVLLELLKVSRVKQIVVVDDGSTDNSLEVINSVKNSKIQVIHQKNQGKGSAIRTGLVRCTEEYVLIQDADLEYHPEDIESLIFPIERRLGVDVVYGSRFLGPHLNLLFWHMIGNSFLNFVVNILYNTTLSDMETCYKLIPTELFKSLDIKSNGFEIEPEITCKLLKRGVKIYEVPISYVGRDFSQGKKITWQDGIKALWTIIKFR